MSRLGNEGRRALKLLNNIDVDDVRKALRKMGKKVLRETREFRARTCDVRKELVLILLCYLVRSLGEVVGVLSVSR